MINNNNEINICINRSKLEGIVKVSGAKNSALRLLAASILTSENIELTNFPCSILDAQIHIKMLEKLGKNVIQTGNTILVQENKELSNNLYWNERSIRNTLLIMGALTARFHQSMIPIPGGCNLGERKYDLHIMILKKFGACIWEENGYLFTSAKNGLKGCDIYLPIRSTGATENAIILGTLASGITRIWNPHIRPEIIDLVNFIKKMGVPVKIYGQQHIEITGVEKLNGTKHTVVPDNMEAITWAIASVITNGDVEIENFPFDHLEVPLIFLRESGMKYYRGNKSLIVRGGKPYPVEISTGPFPGINSDMQPLFAVYGSCSKGFSKIIDLRFPGRYDYAKELAKMGLSYTIEGQMLIINGGSLYKGNIVKALDLRAGAAILLAGLVAEGETTILDSWQIERGYDNIKTKLKNLSVNI